ncbi:Two component system histidine kinase [Desulfonema magnum]|uniref:Chemotaxis protein CheA n=2 Tax=Desulfonema magnum TaxID=45655 RepID=A0A975BSL1_9BACT|nr:Two component system histidine kinase [Desulfonema magnum]
MYIETYRQEAEELLNDIEETILNLEQNPHNREFVNRLFRSMHTIKGSGAMFGFNDIARFAHHVETVLDHVRNDKISVTDNLINLVLASRDQIKMMLDAADDTGMVIDVAIRNKLISALKRLVPDEEHVGEKTVESETSVEEHETTYRIRFRPVPDIIKTGTDPAPLLNELSNLGECRVVALTEEIPTLDKLIPHHCYLFWDISLTTSLGINTIKDVFIFVEENSLITIEEIMKDATTEQDDLVPRLGDILVERGDTTPEEINKVLIPHQNRIGELFIESGTISPDKIKSALNEQKAANKQKTKVRTANVRVSSHKLDKLISLVGELVMTQARISQISTVEDDFEDMKQSPPSERLEQMIKELANPVEILERLTADLRECALNMRMLPIGTIFGKFRRLVRDLSAELGKDIQLVTDGAKTELDKTIIERLDDLLVHLVRNSIDHGIRSPEERKHFDKSRKGTIRLTAAHKGDRVIISVEDDGMGMDPEVIRTKAVEKGLISEDAELSEQELFALVFTPGFSTAGQVTNVSGRGVGLDVVKREVDSLGGSVQLTSKKGHYLRISLSLPLTLAIIDSLLTDVGGSLFVLPLLQVEKCAMLTKDLVEKSHGRNMIQEKDGLIPFIRLRELFNISAEKPSSEEQIVIVKTDNFRVGIVVDKIIRNIQAVIKSLDKNYQDADGISGATIMGNGTVALIIDIPKLISCAREEEEKTLKNIMQGQVRFPGFSDG